MRLIGELEDDQQANLFSAFLLTKGIASQVDQVDGKSEIWVKDEDRFKEAVSELDLFVANPADSKYENAVQQAKIISRAEEKKRQKIQRNLVHVGAGKIPRRRPLTIGLIVACVVVGLLTGFGEKVGHENGVAVDHPVYQALQFVSVNPPLSKKIALAAQNTENGYDQLSVRFASISRGEIWRLVTTIFIHYGIFHIVFNMIWLFQFGTEIEHRYGTWKFGLLVLLVAAISSSFQCGVPDSIGGSQPGLYESYVLITRVGGMSGVVYGLFGFIWMKSTYDRSFGYQLPQSTVVILVGWLFFCMLPTEIRENVGFGSSVANWAHGIGLLVGMAIGYWTAIAKPMKGR